MEEMAAAEALENLISEAPIVQELKRLDDQMLEAQKEYEREIQKLRRVYQERQMPFLEERDKANTLEQPPGPPEGNWNTQTKAGC
eukprot:g33271.t1